MAAMMIRCPVTGRDIATGIETELSVFMRLPAVESRLHCPACGGEHVWTKLEAWLERSPKLAPTAERSAGPLDGLAHLHRAFEVDRDELGDPPLSHGDAEQAVHAGHGDRIVGDDDKAGAGLPRHLVE